MGLLELFEHIIHLVSRRSVTTHALASSMPPIAVEQIPAEPVVAKTSTPAPVSSNKYQVLEQPSGTGRKLRVIVIGAGASALNFAHDIDTSPLDIDLVCYEKNPDIGGTWFENKYPGCACDIPSVLYQYSWAPSPEWSS